MGPSAGSAGRRGGDVRGRGEVLRGGCALSPLEGSPRPDHHVQGLQGKLWFPSLYLIKVATFLE